MAFIQYCAEQDFDVSTQTCSAAFWGPSPSGGLPPLSVADAQTLGIAILTLWAVAYAIRAVIRALKEIG